MTIPLAIAALLAAAQIPAVPTEVTTIAENNRIVLRTLDGGKPLYTFDKDTGGKSSCYDRCATAWPPLAAPKNAKPVGSWTVVARTDGSNQWAYQGKPVYSYVRDSEGVATGDGSGGVWHLLPTTPYR